MAWKKFKVKKDTMTPIKDVFSGVAKRLGLDERYKDFELLHLWKDVAEQFGSRKIASRTFPHRFTKDRVLVIGVTSAALANELQFKKTAMEQRFNDLAHEKYQRTINGLIFELREDKKPNYNSIMEPYQ